MLHVITGPLHSDLEDVLANHLQSLRSHSPLSPLTIVVPSDMVRLRLEWVLCAERHLSLFNIHILTFFQLALRVVEEHPKSAAHEVRSDSFFREWIHHLLQRRKALVPNLARLTDIPGAWAALWSTIKDLKDGSVDAAFALDTLKQSTGEHDPVSQSVLRLYDWYCQEQSQRSVFDCDDVAKVASGNVTTSSFLSEQEQIWYYGFYDLTQVQLDFFHAIAQTYPTTVYFPIVRDHPAYHFAQEFFDRHLSGLSAGRIQESQGSRVQAPLQLLFTKPDQGLRSMSHHAEALDLGFVQESFSSTCQVIHVSGADDEIAIVAKDILRYAEESQIPWHEMGVVGRTLSGYDSVVPRIFGEHGIPFNTTMQRALAEFPFVQSVLRLLNLPVSDYSSGQVMDVLTSPYFHVEIPGLKKDVSRPDLWDQASRRMGMSKGKDEWSRFFRVCEKEAVGRKRRQKQAKVSDLSSEHIHACKQTLQVLFDALHRFPSHASYAEFVDRTKTLLEEILVPSSLESGSGLSAFDVGKEPHSRDWGTIAHSVIAQAVYDQLAEIRKLTQIAENVSLPEFVETVERFMQSATVPLHPTTDLIDGVWVLDAMAARGYSFRVLFVVGVNEQIFPRHIREDAFLRDPIRRFLDMNLGFKVPEKVAGYAEEQLLFYLLVNSAKDAVTLLTQRSNQHDRSSVPSWYISECQRCIEDLPVTVVPKRGSEKRRALPQYENCWLTAQELRVQWMLDHRLPREPFLEHALCWSVIQRGVAALACHESSAPRLNQFDGITGYETEYWHDMQKRGMSPTALEHYARCPFSFFAKQVLQLESVSLPDSDCGIGPRETGTLLHHVLKECVVALMDQEVFLTNRESLRGQVPDMVLAVADRVFQQYEQWSATGYPLLWELQQEQLVDLATQVLLQDLFSEDGEWQPVGFEEAVKGEMPVVLGAEPHLIPLIGRIDRVDWSDSRQQSRIIDYKYKMSARSIPSIQILARDVVRGVQLQAPLYLLLAEGGNLSASRMVTHDHDEASSCAGTWLYYITPDSLGATPVALTQEMWQAVKPQFETTMNVILGGIQRGDYFIVPGGHCQMCDYRTICHRTHSISRWRAGADRPLTQAHRDVRFLKPNLPPKSNKASLPS